MNETATYTAEFATQQLFAIIFKNGSSTLQTSYHVAGEIPNYTGSTPTKEASAQYTYAFNGWSPTITTVTGDATYTATFTGTIRKYTITWKNDDGTTLATTTVAYGETPSYTGATPSKEASVQYTYTFNGWSPTITTVTGNATYTAIFNNVTRSYTLTFIDYYGRETIQSLEYGTTIVFPETITETHCYNVTFLGWYTGDTNVGVSPAVQVNGEATYTSSYSVDSIRSGAISATLQYNNAGDLVITLHVSADPNVGINNANAFNLSILYQGNTIDNIELAASSSSMYMYKGTVTIPASALGSAQEIRVMFDDTSSADVEEHLSKTIDDVLIAYVEALKNTSVSGSLASQQKLATNMLYYANAVYNYFYGDHVFSETTAFPDINASDYATGNGPTSVSAGGSDTASASFKGAIVNFERKSSLHLYYTLTLPTGSAIVKQGVIEFDQAPGALSGKFTGQDGGTFYPYYKTDKNGDFAATDKKGIDQLGDHYYTVYVEYTCEGETHYLYGQTMQYGISRYLRSQIYKYCPAEIGGKGTLLSAADQATAQQKTMEYVNLLYSMLQVYNATQELQANASVEATQ